MSIEIPTTINLDGIQYSLDQFSQTVKNLTVIRSEWANDLRDAQLETLKCETAIKSIDVELAKLVASELAAKTKPVAAPEQPAEPTE